jgi:hypothetical protein
MRLRALVLAAGLVWPVMPFRRPLYATRSLSYWLRTFLVFALAAHPETRDFAAAGEGLMALQAAFPCH